MDQFLPALPENDLTQTKPTNGLSEYTYNEERHIRLELHRYATAKQEDISSGTVNEWIRTFAEMGMREWEVIKRIQIAKCSEKYGSTDFSTFINCNLSEHAAIYNNKKPINIPEVKTVAYGKAMPLSNHFRNLQKPEYEILDELPPDKDSAYGYILIRDDINYSAFYPKEHFKIKQ